MGGEMKGRVGWVIFFLLICGVVWAGCDADADDDDDENNDDDHDDDDNDDNNDDDDFALAETVTIAAGAFEMGCEPEEPICADREQPRHTVFLSEYSIDVYEVTNARYAAFLNVHGNVCDGLGCLDAGEDSYTRIHEAEASWGVDAGYENHPVVEVLWGGAKAFCEAVGGRLPTEAEWEKAAKGAAEHFIYPWGDEWDGDAANYRDSDDPWDNVGEKPWTTPVGYFDGTDHGGTYPTSDGRSPYGLHDMAGNAWEWVNDWFGDDYYTTSPANDPTGPADGYEKVIRGGSFNVSRDVLRTTRRATGGIADTCHDVGFRCAYD